MELIWQIIYSNTTFCLLFRLILTFANLVNSTERGPVLWVFKSKKVKNLNWTDIGRFFSSLGDFHHRPSSGRNVIRTTTTQLFTKTSQELPIMSRSLSDCQEVTLMVTLLRDLCGMINLIRCFAEKHLPCFWIDLIWFLLTDLEKFYIFWVYAARFRCDAFIYQQAQMKRRNKCLPSRLTCKAFISSDTYCKQDGIFFCFPHTLL